MTTKKARSRRLVPSENYTRTGGSGDLTWRWAQSGFLTTDASRRIHRNPRHRWWCGRVQWEAVLYHPDNSPRQIYTDTRLALHDAILRAGWPSPWHEVGTTLTAPFVADMQAAGWTTELDTVFREDKCAGTAETTFDGVHMIATVWRDMIAIRCRAPGIGPIGYRTAYTMAEWRYHGAVFFTAKIAQNFRQSLQTPAEFVWAPNPVPYPFYVVKA